MMNMLAFASQVESEWGFRLKAYLVNIGWAVAGGIAMGLGLIIALKTFTLLTRDVDEWKLVKEGNLGMAIILSSVVLGTSFVVMMMASPGR
jgi:uncharacterized membrane protein YjfL (UPF0719 family)